jgi:hypothetical protein
MIDRTPPTDVDHRLLRRGFVLEHTTLAWNVVGLVVLVIAVVASRSVALAGFGLDSLIEIGASTVMIWELSGTGEQRQRRALRLIGLAFVVLSVYLTVQSTIALITAHHRLAERRGAGLGSGSRWAGRGLRAGSEEGGRSGSRSAAGPHGAGRAGCARGSDVTAAVDDALDPDAGRRADPGRAHVSADTVGDLLREEGFSLQGNVKTIEGAQHPDRDAQFRYLNERGHAVSGGRGPGSAWTPRRRNWSGSTATPAGSGDARASRSR